jgi:adenylate cyclase
VGTEIERKFLVSSDALSHIDATHQVALRQGYLSSEPGRTVRVRLQNEQGYLTIKGRARGYSRPEFEYPIPKEDAEALLALCPGPLIEKWRHYVEYSGKVWEVDEFFGDNAGLVIAELELDDENEAFERPSWVGEEVTFDARYHNSRLAEQPYKSWSLDNPEGAADSSKIAVPDASRAPFVLVVELYVQPGEEEAFHRYEEAVLGLFGRYGLALKSKIVHGARSLGEASPFETHIILVPNEAQLAAFEADPERVRWSADRDRILLRTVSRRGSFA